MKATEERSEAHFPSGARGVVYAALSLPMAAYAKCHKVENRFAAAQRLAAAMQPVFWMAARLGLMRNRENPQEKALGIVCLLLCYWNVEFPVSVALTCDAPLDGPLLVLVRHSLINQLVISRLAREERPVSALMFRPFGLGRVFGTSRPLDVIPARKAMSMRTVAKRLQSGRIVFVAIDAPVQARGYGMGVDAALGRTFMSDQPIRLAVHLGVPMATCFNQVRWGEVVSEIRLIRHTPIETMAAETQRRLWPAP